MGFAGGSAIDRQMIESMASETSDADTTSTYHLRCTDCVFEATVEADLDEALDVANDHQEGHGETTTDHFVNFVLRE